MRIDDDKRNVFLVGLMGAGKTTLGRTLARRLAYEFVDSDHEIQARTGVSLPTIFEIEGEEGFRRREAQVIADLAKESCRVVATGGGAVLRPENRENLSTGIVIYLDVPLHILCERTRHDKNRPLLQQVPDPLQKFRELHAERDPLYRGIATLVLSGSRITVQSVLNQLRQ